MNYFQIISLSIGMFCMGCLFTIALNNKNEVIKIFCFYYSSFCAFILITILRNFLYSDERKGIIIDLIASLQFLTLFLSLLTLAFLLNKILLVPYARRNTVILASFAVCFYIISVFEQFIFKNSIDEVFYIAMFVYYCFVFFKYRKNVINDILKKIMNFAYIISILFIPGIIMDEVITAKSGFLLFTSLFLILNGVFSVYYFNRMSNTIQNGILNISKDFIEHYRITKRETEVMVLLLKGYSYSRIAAELIISISTVRTHVTNIYKKASVNSRYELYNLIN